MKRFWPFLIWLFAGALLGQFTAGVLFPAWAKLGILMPVAKWLATFGSKSLDWYWLIIYCWLLSWLIVALVSIIGGLLVKRYLLLNMLLFGIGFAFVPLALHAYLYSSIPSFLDYELCIIIVGVAVAGGLLSNKYRLKQKNPAA